MIEYKMLNADFLISVIPEYKQFIEYEARDLKDSLPHCLFGNTLNRLVPSLLKNENYLKNDILNRIFEMYENLAATGDSETKNLLQVTLLEYLWDNKITYTRAMELMGKETRKIWDNINGYMSIPTQNSKHIKMEKYTLHLKKCGEIQTVDTEYQFDEDNDIAKLKVYMRDEIIEVESGCTELVFAKLSKILKEKYEIYSCYTCRYGNFCPFGDQDNELFCVNDFEPKCKGDLIPVMSSREELEKRSRTLFDICDGYKPCSDDYYTYK